MRVAIFSTKSYDRQFFEAANREYRHELIFFEPRLTAETAILANGYPVVCAFINDRLDATTLQILAAGGTHSIALRSAGFNHIDLKTAKNLGLTVVRVPAYSPYAVAEHAVALILMLNRKLYRAYNRVREDNFSLEGLLGFDLHGSTVGIVGTGKIGACFARIMHGFGCHLLAYDIHPNPECLELGVEYAELPEVLGKADIVSLHCPLIPATERLINRETLQYFQLGAMLINTSRGGLIDTEAAIKALKSGRLGSLGIDVYEQEENLFFEDLSTSIIQDDTFQLLQSFNNVVITAHQGFFTRNALEEIAKTTLQNITDLERGIPCANEIHSEN
ncbi:MAG TPA: 2-hydroxyacid dehydrogenase [Oscillatoriales cyanobacterium M59_W2019_021]|nr:MAG: 2-hydroxyacid dehydrogenase [Cyanobacteria bacterium J055]HIK32499.1 2-hydroxyacid dehydrogenase [Oscillatoriales cyanobacterium M4454_W2019_049]HIK49665.1 2-hydroxyacid dehydrogenase [Oscillatoriales cyanobacterium M59_W2019_021]